MDDHITNKSKSCDNEISCENASGMTPLTTNVQVPHNETLTTRLSTRAMRQAFTFSRKIIKGKVNPTKEQMQVTQELIRAYAAVFGKDRQNNAPSKQGTIKINNTIARPGTGGNTRAGGQAGSTNANASGGIASERAVDSVSAMTIKERLA
jgi:hypothetical protein